MSRLLKPEGFGQLNFAFAVMGIVSVFANLGLDNIIVRDLSKGVIARGALLGQAIFLKAIGAFVAFGLAVTYAAVFSPDSLLVIAVCCLSFFVQSFDVFELLYHSRLLSSRVVMFRFVGFAIGAILRLILLLNHGTVAMFAALVTIEALLGTTLIVVAQLKNGVRLQIFPLHREIMKALLVQSLPLILYSFAALLVWRFDIVLLEYFVPARTLGLYAVSPRIVELFNVITVAVVGSSLPLLATATGERHRQIVSTLLQVITGIAWLIVLAGGVAAGVVIPLLFGASYTDAVPIFRIYVFSVALTASLGVRAAILMNSGELWILAKSSICAASVSGGLYFWAAQTASNENMASAVLLGHAFNFFVIPLLFPALRETFILQVKALFGVTLVQWLRKPN